MRHFGNLNLNFVGICTFTWYCVAVGTSKWGSDFALMVTVRGELTEVIAGTLDERVSSPFDPLIWFLCVRLPPVFIPACGASRLNHDVSRSFLRLVVLCDHSRSRVGFVLVNEVGNVGGMMSRENWRQRYLYSDVPRMEITLLNNVFSWLLVRWNDSDQTNWSEFFSNLFCGPSSGFRRSYKIKTTSYNFLNRKPDCGVCSSVDYQRQQFLEKTRVTLCYSSAGLLVRSR